MKIRKNIVLLSVTIVILISLVAIATYSYFTASSNINNKITTNVKMPLRPTFAVSGGGEMTLAVPREALFQENGTYGNWVEGKNIVSSTKNLIVTLTGEPGTTCTYNVYYKDISADSTILRNRKWDFSFYLYKNNTTIIEGQAIDLLRQTSAGVPKITAMFGGSPALLNQAKPVITIPSGSTSATDKWEFKLAFLNIGEDQSNLANKTFKGEVYIDDVSCT